MGGSVSKESTCNAGDAGDAGLIPGSGRSPREGNGNPLQYSCLETLMDRGAWRATVHGVAQESDMIEAPQHAHALMHARILCIGNNCPRKFPCFGKAYIIAYADCKTIPWCELNPKKEKSYLKFQAFPPAETEAGMGDICKGGRGRVLCNEWKKHWRVYKQSQCIEATASEIFRWGLGGTQNHKLNHLSSFQQRRRLPILCLVLLCFEDWCQNESTELLLVFSFLICQMKIHFWGGGILRVLQMSFIQNLCELWLQKILSLFNFKRAMEISWRSLLSEISLGVSDMGEGGWFVISNPLRWEGFFKIIESRVRVEDIKLLLLIGGFKARSFVFPDSLVA